MKSILLPSFPDSWTTQHNHWTEFLSLGDSPERLIGLANANRTDKRGEIKVFGRTVPLKQYHSQVAAGALSVSVI